jgi:hypothetical protein
MENKKQLIEKLKIIRQSLEDEGLTSEVEQMDECINYILKIGLGR